MSKLTIYHGSQVIVEKPRFGVGNPNNDYGLGFYCTETPDLAKEWACSPETDGYANKYALDMSGLRILSLTGGDYNILNWLAILLENRQFRIGGDVARQARDYIIGHFGIEYRSCDVIKGYRADDSYFSFASAFLNNTISISQLERSMKLGNLGQQVVVVSQRAFDAISFEEAIAAPKEIFYPRKLARDTAARQEFRREKGQGSVLTETYILDIIRQEWKNDDERLQRIILG